MFLSFFFALSTPHFLFFSIKGINLSLAFDSGIDLKTFQTDYKDSCLWEIVDVEAERCLTPENDTDPYTVLKFTLKFQRKLVFSSYILTLPCIFLVVLTLVVFWLPADRPDRIGLCKTPINYFLIAKCMQKPSSSLKSPVVLSSEALVAL